MRQFDFYEFVGVIVPGAVFLTGVALGWPDGSALERIGTLSIGGLGLGVIFAYAVGHLIQAVGNIVEKVWWWMWRGMPSDWPRSGAHILIASSQAKQLEERVSSLLHQPEFMLSSTDRREWYSIVRQIYSAVAKDGRTARIDVFNGNYGLCRGLAASFIAIIPSTALIDWPGWGITAAMVVAAVMALYRMHTFGVHYGREVFVQFLAIQQPKSEVASA